MGAKGQPKTGGRKKGTSNVITKDIKATAAEMAPMAMKRIGEIAKNKTNPAVALAACKEIMDRHLGKAVQHVDGEINIYDNLTLGEKEALLRALDTAIADEEGPPDGPDETYH